MLVPHRRSALQGPLPRRPPEPHPTEEQHDVIVAGHLEVDPGEREGHLADCVTVIEASPGSGPSDEQGAAMLSASVAEYDVAGMRSLTCHVPVRGHSAEP